MPWFALDDGFTTHPKVRAAGNAAAGLFCRLGAHCAKHLTDGVMDGVLARSFGTPAQLRKLVAVGLLHEGNHACERCPQAEDGSYVLHDYLDYNRSRKQIEASRENGRKRQQKGRERQRENRNGTETEGEPRLNRGRTEAQPGLAWDSSDPQIESRFEGSVAGQRYTSRRDTLQGATVVPAPPSPAPPSLPAEEKELASYARDAISAGVQPQFQELAEALHYAGIEGLGWDLRGDLPFQIEALIKAKTIPAMVTKALASRDRARTRISNVSYFLRAWMELPTITGPPPAQPLPMAAGGEVVPFQRPGPRSLTDDRVQQAHDAGDRLQAFLDARQESS